MCASEAPQLRNEHARAWQEHAADVNGYAMAVCALTTWTRPLFNAAALVAALTISQLAAMRQRRSLCTTQWFARLLGQLLESLYYTLRRQWQRLCQLQFNRWQNGLTKNGVEQRENGGRTMTGVEFTIAQGGIAAE